MCEQKDKACKPNTDETTLAGVVGEDEVCCLSGLNCWVKKKGWVFRGQKDYEWALKTSLERTLKRHDIKPDDRRTVEGELIREFKRAYHHYSADSPASEATFEWLALMQHHGAPTRLLDFTYSIHIAAYFATECATGDAAIWAINTEWAHQAAGQAFGKGLCGQLSKCFEGDMHKLLTDPVTPERERRLAARVMGCTRQGPVKAVCVVNPFRLNQRLTLQKGVFAVPCDVTTPFEENLKGLSGLENKENISRIRIPKNSVADLRRELYGIGLSRRMLFPGLDGYAQSLGIYHHRFD